jgi:hypothetical protein
VHARPQHFHAESDRISGQGSRSGRVGFLPRPAHATREDRARHAAVRLKRDAIAPVETARSFDLRSIVGHDM